MRYIGIIALLASAPAIAGKQTDRTHAAETAWGHCVVANAQAMAGRADPQSVVEASFGMCGAEQDTFRTEVLKYSQCSGFCGGYTRDQLDAEMDKTRALIKPSAFAAVIAALPPAH